MRRLGRWTLNGLTMLSLLLCVGWFGLWAWSYRVGNAYTRVDGGWATRIVHTRGVVSASFRHMLDDEVQELPAHWKYRSAWSAALPERPDARDPGVRSFRALPGMAWCFTNGGKFALTKPFTDPRFHKFSGASEIEMGFRPRREVYVRDWIVALALATLPVGWLVRRWARAAAIGRCAACGYDLTGNVSGVCPECGTSVAKGG